MFKIQRQRNKKIKSNKKILKNMTVNSGKMQITCQYNLQDL